jgi:hypothetical protein
VSARARSAAVVAVVIAASVATSALTAGPAAAAGAADRLAGTTEYLARSQLRGGDLHPPAPLLIDGPSTQAWGALGLAAGGISATEQRERPGTTTLYDSLKGNLGVLNATGDIALFLLVEPTVHDVRDDDGTKGYEVEPLINAVLADQVRIGPDAGGFAWQSPGFVAADARSTALAALALEGVRDDPDVRLAVGDPIVNAVGWLVDHGPAGTWTTLGESTPDTETSALAVQAIQASRLSSPTLRNAVSAFGAWLQQRQNPDGGFGTGAPGGPSDLLATAAVASALAASGTPPSEFHHPDTGATPIDFLGAAQDPVDHHVGTADPLRTTGYAALAFASASLPLGYVTGSYGIGSQPPQRVPQGLPTGPTLPIEVPATRPSTPTPRPATTPAAAPVLQPRATTPARVPSTVHRIKNPKKSQSSDGGDGDAGSGNGSSGGAGGGTVATAGAPDRAGGGGGAGTSVTAATSIPASAVPTPPAEHRRGGTPTKATSRAPREVRGTLIGRDSATPGTAGSRAATPGAAGASAGHVPTPWWAIALALAILAAIATGIRLDHRHPEVAL